MSEYYFTNFFFELRYIGDSAVDCSFLRTRGSARIIEAHKLIFISNFYLIFLNSLDYLKLNCFQNI